MALALIKRGPCRAEQPITRRHIPTRYNAMDEEGIARIERELGVHLPGNYAEALRQYLFPVASFTAECLLWNDAQRLIDNNRDSRPTLEIVKSNVIPEGHLFQIGHDGGEQTYYIDLEQDSSPIYVHDHELGTITEQCAGLESWQLHCRDTEAEIQADRAHMARIVSNKRWWQFWK